jgi:hypothetical protein
MLSLLPSSCAINRILTFLSRPGSIYMVRGKKCEKVLFVSTPPNAQKQQDASRYANSRSRNAIAKSLWHPLDFAIRNYFQLKGRRSLISTRQRGAERESAQHKTTCQSATHTAGERVRPCPFRPHRTSYSSLFSLRCARATR